MPGYKRLYTGFDVASIFLLLLLLAVRKQPLTRVLTYAWNPSVVVTFAMCGHHDSLAILALLAANLLIIAERRLASIALLVLSFLAKFFTPASAASSLTASPNTPRAGRTTIACFDCSCSPEIRKRRRA